MTRKLLPSRTLVCLASGWIWGLLWLGQGNESTNLWDAVVLGIVFLGVYIWGTLVVSALGWEDETDFPPVIIVGWAFVSLVLCFSRFFLLSDIRWTLGLLLLVGLFLILRRCQRPSVTSTVSICSTVVSLAASTFLVADLLPPMVQEEGRVIVRPIRDQFVHAQMVGMLSNPTPTADLGRIGLAGEPIPMYHYASYAIPAALSSLTGRSPYDISVTFWLPWCFVLLGLSAHVLVARWASPTLAWVGPAVLLCLPDPASWFGGLDQPTRVFYSFPRVIEYAGSNGYAIAIVGVSLSLLTSAIQRRSGGLLTTSLALAAVTLFFKAQIFVLAFPVVFLLTLWTVWRRRMVRPSQFTWLVARPVGWVILAAFGGIGAWIAWSISGRAPTIQLEWPPGQRLTEFLFTLTREEPFVHEISQWALEGGVLQPFARALLVYWVPLRWMTLLLMMALGVSIWRKRIRQPDVVIIMLTLALYGGYALLLAPNFTGHTFGNPWDLLQVPFLLMYFVAALWCWGAVARGVLGVTWDSSRIRWIVSIVALAIPWSQAGRAKADFLTDEGWAYLPVDPGLIESAEFLRLQAEPSDLFLDSENDPYYLVEALSARRAYVGWPVVGTYTSRDPGDELFQDRCQWHDKVRKLPNWSDAKREMNLAGIRWYLLHPEAEVSWRPAETDVAFSLGGYRVLYIRDESDGEQSRPIKENGNPWKTR